MDFSVRRAVVTDLEPLVEIEHACFRTDRIKKRQMRYLLTKAKAVTFVATSEQSVIGYLTMLIPQSPRPVRIYSLAVDPVYRGNGVAKKLIAALFMVCKELRRQRVRLEVRESDLNVQSLYTKMGFSSIKTLDKYYEDGENGIRMECRLLNITV